MRGCTGDSYDDVISADDSYYAFLLYPQAWADMTPVRPTAGVWDWGQELGVGVMG